MDQSDDEQVLDCNPNRQATHVIRGFFYQAWQTLYAWIDLGENESLHIEGAEDFEVFVADSVSACQIRDTKTPISLRSESVLCAIANFWELRSNNPTFKIKYIYLTRSKITIEQGHPLGDGIAGLHLWETSKRNKSDLKKLIEFLQHDVIVQKHLTTEVKDFLNYSPLEAIKNDIIEPFSFFTEAPAIESIVEAIKRKLAIICENEGAPIYMVSDIITGLFMDIASKLKEPNSKDRFLNRGDFLLKFTALTRKSVSIIEHEQLRRFQTECSNMILNNNNHLPGFIWTKKPNILMDPILLPGKLFKRSNLVNALSDIALESGFLWLYGSVGVGKTTLAKLVSHSIDREWSCVSVRNLHENEIMLLLKEIAQTIDLKPEKSFLILDDLELLKIQANQLENYLFSIVFTIRERKGIVIVTSRNLLSQSRMDYLNVTNSSFVNVPYMSEKEITEFCTTSGCSKILINKWSKLIFLQSLGHPQLVHARVLAISKRHWPKINNLDLVENPDDIAEERGQTRFLLDILPIEDRVSLYICSLAIPPFRGSDIKKVLEKENVPFPGDSLNRLIGPWIEKVSAEYYRISPLLSKVGCDVWSRERQEEIHHKIVDSIMYSGSHGPTEINNALYHAINSNNSETLLKFWYSIFTLPEDALKIVAFHLDWFLALDLKEHSTFISKDRLQIKVMYMILQYKFAAISYPSHSVKLFKQLECEFRVHEGNSTIHFYYYLFVFLSIVYVQVPIKFSEVIKFLREFLEYPQILNKYKKGKRQEILLPDGFSPESRPELVAINIVRCQTIDDLVVLLETVRKRDELGNLTRKALELKDDYATALFSNFYRSLKNDENVDAESVVSVLKQMILLGIELNLKMTTLAACQTACVVLDEILGKPHDALELLDSVEISFSKENRLMASRATVLMRLGIYDQAYFHFSAALSDMTTFTSELNSNPAYICRDAGLVAAKLGYWTDSARFFELGADCLSDISDETNQIAFIADAAWIYWKGNEKEAAIKSLEKVVACLKNDLDIKKNKYLEIVYRLTGHIVVAILEEAGQRILGDAIAKPEIGIVSNPYPNMKILDLPYIPLDFLIYNLSQLEKLLRINGTMTFQFVELCRHHPVPTLKMFAALEELRNQYSQCNFSELMPLMERLISSYLASKSQINKNNEPWQETSVVLSREELLSGLRNTNWCYLIPSGFLLKVYLAGDSLDEAFGILLGNPKKFTIKDLFEESIQLLKDLFKKTRKDLVQELYNPNSKAILKQLAAFFLMMKGGVELDYSIYAQVHLHRLFRDSIMRDLIEQELSKLIVGYWIEKTKASFLFQSPGKSIPRIRALCDSCKLSYKGCASLIQKIAIVIGINLPNHIKHELMNVK